MSSRLLFEREKDATVGMGSEMGFCMLVGTRLVYMKNSFPQRQGVRLLPTLGRAEVPQPWEGFGATILA